MGRPGDPGALFVGGSISMAITIAELAKALDAEFAGDGGLSLELSLIHI